MCSCGGSQPENPTGGEGTAQEPITNESEAISQASRLTGLDSLPRKITAQRVTVKNDETPFLWRQINGKSAWQ